MRDYKILLNELAHLLGKPFGTSVWRIKGMVATERDCFSNSLFPFFYLANFLVRVYDTLKEWWPQRVSQVLCLFFCFFFLFCFFNFFFLSFVSFFLFFFNFFLLPTCSIPAPSSSIIPEAVKWHLVKVAVLLSHLGRLVKARLVKVTVPVGTVNKEEGKGQSFKYTYPNKLCSYNQLKNCRNIDVPYCNHFSVHNWDWTWGNSLVKRKQRCFLL